MISDDIFAQRIVTAHNIISRLKTCVQVPTFNVKSEEDVISRHTKFIKDGFEGLIKEGTPIAQIIPIKTEPWKLERNTNLLAEAKLARSESLKHIIGWYKNKYWKRKEYK